MRQLQDDDLILYFYGEAETPEEIRKLLASSAELRSRFEALRRALEAAGEALPVPERPDSYGAEVWARLQPRLEETHAPDLPGRGRILSFLSSPGGRTETSRRVLAGIAAAAAVLLLGVGFLAGRFWPRPGEPRIAEAPLPAGARERILVRTVAAHLERSERLLTELANAETDSAVDISAERQWARDLLSANRLYRQSTRQGGRPRLASLLDELEPFLLELAHG
ncbi:MAG TPA: hypothetical protein VGG03_18235, partial [Thermoanaerobaculia bacterium]